MKNLTPGPEIYTHMEDIEVGRYGGVELVRTGSDTKLEKCIVIESSIGPLVLAQVVYWTKGQNSGTRYEPVPPVELQTITES